MKMKNVLKLMMLFVMTFGISTMLTSCGDDEPETPVETPDDNNGDSDNSDNFADLYGYWINADKSGAMNIVKYSANQCKVLYYVYCEAFQKKYAEWESYYSGGAFTVLAPYNEYKSGCEAIYVKIKSSSYNKIVLVNSGSVNTLSSYIFSRVSEDEFFEYLENGGKKEPTGQQSQLAGTNWSARIDGDYVELSFKSNGTFTEIWSGEKSNSTYTELDSNTIIIGDGTVLSNIFGESPFNFSLNSNKTQLTLSDRFEKLVFTRKQ